VEGEGRGLRMRDLGWVRLCLRVVLRRVSDMVVLVELGQWTVVFCSLGFLG